MILKLEEILLATVKGLLPNPDAYLTGDNLVYVKYMENTIRMCATAVSAHAAFYGDTEHNELARTLKNILDYEWSNEPKLNEGITRPEVAVYLTVLGVCLDQVQAIANMAD